MSGMFLHRIGKLQFSSQPGLLALKLATIIPSETPNVPTYAAILPPPGAILSDAVSLARFLALSEISFSVLASCN